MLVRVSRQRGFLGVKNLRQRTPGKRNDGGHRPIRHLARTLLKARVDFRLCAQGAAIGRNHQIGTQPIAPMSLG